MTPEEREVAIKLIANLLGEPAEKVRDQAYLLSDKDLQSLAQQARVALTAKHKIEDRLGPLD